MSSKTKIVVLHLKELVYTSVFIVLGILFIILLLMMFQPDKEKSNEEAPALPAQALYTPGTYTSTIDLDGTSLDVFIVVDETSILSISLGELSQTTEALYPLIESSFQELSTQICEYQSLDEVSYDPDTKYTSEILLNAISSSLSQASLNRETADEIN